MSEEQERERLRRLRERQLQDRDPGPRVNVEWKGDAAKRDANILKELLVVMPGNIRGGIIGGMVGILLMLLTQWAVVNWWGLGQEWTLCGLAVLALCIIVGVVLGRVMDKRNWLD